jgi:hypothetical protein
LSRMDVLTVLRLLAARYIAAPDSVTRDLERRRHGLMSVDELMSPPRDNPSGSVNRDGLYGPEDDELFLHGTETVSQSGYVESGDSGRANQMASKVSERGYKSE